MVDDKGQKGEDFVNSLAYNSFLKFWCYPGPRNEKGDKKEICDLLVIFNNVVIIISVKNYEFKGNHFRYFNNTIEKAAKQIYGACRLLFGNQEVFIKHPNKNLELFPKSQIEKTFRIIVNLGDGVKFYPFNSSTKIKEYVTLFDKDSFQTIISQLDTIPDFIDYLQKREELFKDTTTIVLPGDEYDFPIETQKEFLQYGTECSNRTIIISGTEKDLLSHFFKNKRSFPKFLLDNSDSCFLKIDGHWEKFSREILVKNKEKADRISYFIDEFVKNELIKNSLLKDLTPMRESLAKSLLSFDRLTRRSIAKNYFEFYELYKNVQGNYFSRRFADINGTGILFTFYTNQMSMEKVETLNLLAVESTILYTNYKSKSMILISTNKDHRFLFSYLESKEKYPLEIEEQIRRDVKTLGWFTKHTEIKSNEKEFPK